MEYRIYRDANNQWRWRLVADNDKIVADSGQGYDKKTDCLHAIGLIKISSGTPVREA